MDKKTKILLSTLLIIIFVLSIALLINNKINEPKKETSNKIKIEITIDDNTIYVGETKKIIYNSDQKLSFESSNISVAQVTSDGTIKGISEGNTTIIVKNARNKKVKEIEINIVNNNIESNSNIVSNSNISNSNIPSNVVSNSNKKSNGNKVITTYKASFVKTSNMDVLTKTSVSCNTEGDSCYITTPNFESVGRIVLGYSTKKGATTAEVGVNTKYKLTKNTVLYTVTKENPNVLTATFDVSRCEEYKSVGTKKITKQCTMTDGNDYCFISNIPYCTVYGAFYGAWQRTTSLGLEPRKVISYKYGKSVLIRKGDKEEFIPFTSFFAFAVTSGTLTKERNFNIANIYKKGNVVVQYEKGIPTTVINNHKKFIDKYYKDLPFLFKIDINIFVLTKETYEEYSSAFGLTIPTGTNLIFIDLKYTGNNNNISENATLHEMAHAWDNNHEYLKGSRISAQTNMDNFYKSIPDATKNNLSRAEWFAGLFTEWYWHYKGNDTSKPSYAGYKDKYNTAQKNCTAKLFNCYVNLANNNYNGSCSNITC